MDPTCNMKKKKLLEVIVTSASALSDKLPLEPVCSFGNNCSWTRKYKMKKAESDCNKLQVHCLTSCHWNLCVVWFGYLEPEPDGYSDVC